MSFKTGYNLFEKIFSPKIGILVPEKRGSYNLNDFCIFIFKIIPTFIYSVYLLQCTKYVKFKNLSGMSSSPSVKCHNKGLKNSVGVHLNT